MDGSSALLPRSILSVTRPLLADLLAGVLYPAGLCLFGDAGNNIMLVGRLGVWMI